MTDASEKPNINVSEFKYVREMPPDSERHPTTLYIVSERVPERDQSLGRFMGKWSSLEQTLQSLTHTLMGGPYSTVGVVFSNCSGIKQIIDLISGLAELNLTTTEFRELSSLLERLRKKNTKRNRLVHGVWVPEITIDCDAKNRPVVSKYVWARIYTPTSLAEQAKIQDIKNSKVRSKYRFTIEDVEKVTLEVMTLRDDFAAFLSPVSKRLRPEGPNTR
ncbi:MAG: hypothetical protein AAFX08_06775 [Pseudomonadota bacterium]